MARSNARLRSRGLANATGTKEVRPVRLRGPGSRTKLLSRTYPHALHPQRTPPIRLAQASSAGEEASQQQVRSTRPPAWLPRHRQGEIGRAASGERGGQAE